jgi:NAD(P)-dependent dehydrogenase (short-subunit alcohol dehydrogenase family)
VKRPTLDGQVALVTGGGRGIGAALAGALADCGAAVALVARSREQVQDVAAAIGGRGGRAVGYPADVSEPSKVEEVVAAVRADLGPVGILVNAAGVMAPVGPDWEVDPREWWHTLEVNLFGTFLCARAVLPGMLREGRGTIVNVSSSAAYTLQPYTSAYGVSKAAITSHTACLAQSAGAHGVRVFAFAPGFVRTRMTERLASAPAGRPWLGGLARALEEGRVTPMERVIEVFLRLVAGEADFLAGRHVDAREDLSAIIAARTAVEQANLLVLQRPTLEHRSGE